MCMSSVVCANGCIVMVCVCLWARMCMHTCVFSPVCVIWNMRACVSLPVNVAWACRSDPHVLMQGLCPCFPVNTLFFSSAAEEGMMGQIGGLLSLLLFSPSVFFSLGLVL